MADVDVELRFYGMCLFLLSEKKMTATALMLNASDMEWQDRKMKGATGGPTFHHPILQLEEDAFLSSTLPRIPNLVGMVNETDPAELGKRLGWHISGLDVAIGSGDVTFSRALPPTRHPESYATGNWRSMGWIPSLNDILPDATLRDGVDKIGHLTSARLILGGGTLEGERPSDAGFGSAVWTFSPGWQQAMTDSVVFRTKVPEGRLKLTDRFGSAFEIVLKPGRTANLWISHEAGTRERAIEHRVLKEIYPGEGLRLNHFPALYHFFEVAEGKKYRVSGIGALDVPRALWFFDPSNPFQDTPVCISGTFVVD